jgi:hypothetical protein
MLGTAFRPSAEISFYPVKGYPTRLQPASAEEKPPGRCGAATVLVGDRKWRHERSG